MNEQVCLGLFAKYWAPGKVKTRLAADTDPNTAAQIYLAFLKTLLRRFGPVDSNSYETVVAYSPAERVAEFQKLHHALQPQHSGDLGDRLHGFFSDQFNHGASSVIVIGSDSPTLPANYLHQAKWLLSSTDVVLGPSEDGGYYLVAARECVPPIFTDISWSSDLVWRQTIARLQDHRVRFAVLPTWYDVDNASDLNRLRAELADTTSQDSKSLRDELDRILDGKFNDVLPSH